MSRPAMRVADVNGVPGLGYEGIMGQRSVSENRLGADTGAAGMKVAELQRRTISLAERQIALLVQRVPHLRLARSRILTYETVVLRS
ncbi:MAG: hypothetical protein EON58_13420 [Alphaproteobacteria bacterium]|nr:MAG: hypothetical protein EON58_13420 [Alphaproteobacteria bacterium]